MRFLVRAFLALVVLVAAVLAVAYGVGATLPVDHTTSITGTVRAAPEKVFGLITNVAAGAAWRTGVKGVQVLPPEPDPNGPQDHWIEDLGHGTTMNFLAVRTQPLTPQGQARRDVLLSDPGAAYGGTWTYELAPGSSPAETILTITETGFIRPPVYRFVMAHVLGMTKNLDQYMSDVKAAAARP
jgi:hypothetical protein